MKRIILFLALTACAWSQPTMPFAVWKSAAVSGYTFKPSYITSGTLKLWLYADTLKTLESKAVGDTLYRWQDISGNGYHMVNTTASQKPILRDSTTAWGQTAAAVTFDGSDDKLLRTVQMVDTTTGFTFFYVSRLISYNSQYKCPVAVQTDHRLWITLATNTAPYNPISTGYDNSQTPDKARHAGYVPTRTSVITQTVQGTMWSETARAMRQDSTTLSKSASTSFGVALNVNTIGSAEGTTYAWNGHIMEVIVYAGILPIADIRKVEEYLRRKYSL